MQRGLHALVAAVLLLILAVGPANAGGGRVIPSQDRTVCTATSADASRIYQGGQAGTLSVEYLNLPARRFVAAQGHPGPIEGISVAATRVLTIGGGVGWIRDIHLRAHHVIKNLGGRIVSCHTDPTGVYGAVGVEGVGVVIFTLKDGLTKYKILDPQPLPTPRFLSNRSIALANAYGGVSLYDFRTNTEPYSLLPYYDEGLGALAVSSDGRYLAMSPDNNPNNPNPQKVWIYDTYSTEVVGEVQCPGRPTALTFFPGDKLLLAVGTETGAIRYIGGKFQEDGVKFQDLGGFQPTTSPITSIGCGLYTSINYGGSPSQYVATIAYGFKGVLIDTP